MASISQRTRSYLFDTYREVRHGAQLKLLAIASRGVFLLFVALRLAPGELTQYVFLSSIAVLGSRVLCFGLEEQLPLQIAGRREQAARWIPFLHGLLIGEVVLAVVFGATGSVVPAVLLLTTCYLTTSLMAGLLRTVRIAGSERLRDLHWVIFVGLLLLPVPWTAVQMIGILAASLMVVQLIEVWLNRVQGITHGGSEKNILDLLVRQALLSWRKLLAASAVLLIVRGIILWPETLKLGIGLDDVAYALLLGEAFWQTAMILVYRRYARYCAMERVELTGVFNDGLKTVAVLMAYGIVAAGVAYGLSSTDFVLAGFSGWIDVSWMILFFAVLASYLLLRYIVWVARDFDWRLTGFEIAFFLSQGAIVIMSPVSAWTGLMAGASIIFLIVTAAYIRLSVIRAV